MKDELDKEPMLTKFSTLYQNLYPLKHTAYKMNTIFCVKRLLYATVCIYLGQFVVPQIYMYIFIPLFSIGYNINNSPMNSRLLNSIENVNETFLLCNGYFLTVFTQWMGPGPGGPLFTLLGATVIEVCSEGSIPIAFEIFNKSGALGNALVFLMAGVATDYTEISLLWSQIGKRTALLLPLISIPPILLLAYLGNGIF